MLILNIQRYLSSRSIATFSTCNLTFHLIYANYFNKLFIFILLFYSWNYFYLKQFKASAIFKLSTLVTGHSQVSV